MKTELTQELLNRVASIKQIPASSKSQEMHARKPILPDRASVKRQLSISLMVGIVASIAISCTSSTPNIASKSSTERGLALSSVTDTAVLAKVALEDSDSSIRKAAVMQLTDQVVLATVAIKEKDGFVRYQAVNRLTDKTTLERVAETDEDEFIRKFALKKIGVGDLAGLLRGRGVVLKLDFSAERIVPPSTVISNQWDSAIRESLSKRGINVAAKSDSTLTLQVMVQRSNISSQPWQTDAKGEIVGFNLPNPNKLVELVIAACNASGMQVFKTEPIDITSSAMIDAAHAEAPKPKLNRETGVVAFSGNIDSLLPQTVNIDNEAALETMQSRLAASQLKLELGR